MRRGRLAGAICDNVPPQCRPLPFTVSGRLVLVAWILSVCSLVGAESLLAVALDVGGRRRRGEALVSLIEQQHVDIAAFQEHWLL